MVTGRTIKGVSFHLIVFFSVLIAGCATLPKKEIGVRPGSQSVREKFSNRANQQTSWNSETIARYTTGLLFKRQGKIKEAIEEFRKAVDVEPGSFSIHQSLGIAYFEAGAFSQAEKEFQTLLKIDAQNPDSYKYLALLSLAQGETDKAEAYYRNVVGLDPELADSYFALAGLYVRQKNYSQAIQVLKKLIKNKPENRKSYIQLAGVLNLDGKKKEAARLLKRARLLFPDDQKMDFALGAIYELQEKWSSAARVYEKLVEVQPNSISLNYRLARVYAELKQYDQVIERYQVILDLAPRDVRTLSIAGLFFYRLEKKEEALKIFQKVLQIDPKNIEAKIVVAHLYEAMNRRPEAIKAYQDVIVLKPDDIKAHLKLAYMYLQEDEFQKALDLLEGKEIQGRSIYFIRGFASFKLKKQEQAVDFFRRAISFSPDDEVSHFYLAVVYEQIGDLPLAIYEFKETIRLNPKFVEAYNYLAYTYAERGIHLDEAVELANKALSFEPENGAYLDTLAWVHYKKGMLDLALKELKRAVILQEDPVIFEHLGDVYHKKRKWKNAREAWEKSLSLDPENKVVLDKILRLRPLLERK